MIRLGVIGHGGRISGVIKHCLRDVYPPHLREDIRVVGIVDPDEEGARSRLADCDREDVVFYPDVETMMRKGKLDGVLIGTRCNLHGPYACEVAKYDVPLYLEKPVSIDMEQAVALERAFENSKCPVVVSFPLRVSPLCVHARKLLAKGAVGELEHINAVNYVPYGSVYWDHEYRNYAITGGLFLQKATHDFDYMMYLMGQPIVRVAAMGNFRRVFGGDMPAGLMCSACDKQESCLESPQNRLRNGSGGVTRDHVCVFGEDCGTVETGTNEDCSSALIEFANGVHGVYTQVFFTRRDAGSRGATVSGYHGTVSFDWYKNSLRHVRHHEPFSDESKAGEGASHFGGDTELAIDFLELVKGRSRVSRTPIETGAASVYSCLAARESMHSGTFQTVRQVGQA